jgi:hypothetical protein
VLGVWINEEIQETFRSNSIKFGSLIWDISKEFLVNKVYPHEVLLEMSNIILGLWWELGAADVDLS